jgi:hypothetical protein
LTFSKFFKDAPNLDMLNRADIDLIFNKVKPVGTRKLFFANFLQGLLELGIMLYPTDDPTTALAKVLSIQILGLFDQPQIPDSTKIIDKLKVELTTFSSTD